MSQTFGATPVFALLAGLVIGIAPVYGSPPFFPPIEGTVGPKGGEVALPDGITLIVGPGVFGKEVPLRVHAVNPVPVRGGSQRFQQLGWAFRVEPALKKAKVNLKVPLSLIPEGEHPHLLKLDLSGPPICDPEKCKGNFYMSTGAIRDGHAWFDISGVCEKNVLQVAIKKGKKRRTPPSSPDSAKPDPTKP